MLLSTETERRQLLKSLALNKPYCIVWVREKRISDTFKTRHQSQRTIYKGRLDDQTNAKVRYMSDKNWRVTRRQKRSHQKSGYIQCLGNLIWDSKYTSTGNSQWNIHGYIDVSVQLSTHKNVCMYWRNVPFWHVLYDVVSWFLSWLPPETQHKTHSLINWYIVNHNKNWMLSVFYQKQPNSAQQKERDILTSHCCCTRNSDKRRYEVIHNKNMINWKN